jgi:hypothetical protein
MAAVQVNAEFEVRLRAGTTLEAVLAAMRPLQDCRAWSPGPLPKGPDDTDYRRVVWMDPARNMAGVTINGPYSQGGMDVIEAVEQAARNLASVSEEPFVVECRTNGGPEPEGFHRTRVFGEHPEAMRDTLILLARSQVASALGRLLELVGTPAGASIAAATDGGCLEALIVGEDADGEAGALPVASVSLSRLQADDRAIAIQMVQTLASLAVRGEAGVAVVRSADAPGVEPPQDLDLAVTRLGPGAWELADGPRTRIGNEFWFRWTQTHRTAYVCVDQGRVANVEIHDQAEGDTPAHRNKEAPRG